MSTKKYKDIRLDFTIYADDEHMPDACELASGIYEGLPKEWYNGEGDYEVISTRFDKFENTPEEDLLITRLSHQKANLAGRNQNLIEKNDNQVEIIKDLSRRNEEQRASIRDWRKLTDELRAQVTHLEEYNSDANVELLAKVASLKSRLDDALMFYKKAAKERDQLKAENRDVNGKLLAEVDGLEAKLEEVESHRDYLLKQVEDLAEKNDNQHKTIVDQIHLIGQQVQKINGKRSRILDLEYEFKQLNAKKVKSVGITNEEHERVRDAIGEAIDRVGQAHIEDSMGALDNLFEEVNDALKMLPVMDERDLGWGDDDQLANLEGSLDDLRVSATEFGDTLDELGDTLNEIRTGR
jgi:myosin heavy subunit